MELRSIRHKFQVAYTSLLHKFPERLSLPLAAVSNVQNPNSIIVIYC